MDIFLVFFYICRMYRYFLDFSRKTSSSIFVRSHAFKSMRMQPSRLLSLFRTRKGYTKREPPGVTFNLFSDSHKHEKIAERPCSFHGRKSI
jgi:hypothetical protein